MCVNIFIFTQVSPSLATRPCEAEISDIYIPPRPVLAAVIFLLLISDLDEYLGAQCTRVHRLPVKTILLCVFIALWPATDLWVTPGLNNLYDWDTTHISFLCINVWSHSRRLNRTIFFVCIYKLKPFPHCCLGSKDRFWPWDTRKKKVIHFFYTDFGFRSDIFKYRIKSLTI